jgi:hypothetical protein
MNLVAQGSRALRRQLPLRVIRSNLRRGSSNLFFQSDQFVPQAEMPEFVCSSKSPYAVRKI